MKNSPATIPLIILIVILLGTAGFEFFSHYNISIVDSSKNNKTDSLKTPKIEMLNLKSFYIPSGRYNETDLYTPDTNGKIDYSLSRGMMETNFYKRQEDSNEYTVTTTEILGEDTTCVTTQFVNFHTNNEVKMTKQLSACEMENDGNIMTYIPDSSEILLEISAIPDSIAHWSYKDKGGATYMCKSHFTTISISGTSKRAIEIEKRIIIGDGETISKWNDYYVQGIGFYKEDFIANDGKIVPFRELGRL